MDPAHVMDNGVIVKRGDGALVDEINDKGLRPKG